jgi:hypothetical protein
VKGRFVYAGDTHFESEAIKIDVCTRGIANVLIYLRPNKEEYRELDDERNTVILVLGDSGFDKRLVGLTVRQSLDIQCRGDNSHHPIVLRPGQTISPRVDPDARYRYTFDTHHPVPIPVQCSVHAEEQAFVFVHANRHFSITGKDGAFRLSGLPSGENEFQVWHEVTGRLNAKPSWQSGRFRLSVEEGGTVDLGTIRVSKDVFDRRGAR